MKSPIIYYGGKSSMLDNILPLIPDHEVYTEVFCGGAAVLFAKKKAKIETINDRLDIVVNFYQQLKTNYDQLHKLIDGTCYARSLHKKAQLIITNKQHFEPVDLAWAFWMLCNFSHGQKIGGGLKYSNDQSLIPPVVMKNKKDQFTKLLVSRIEGVIIENKDAIEILKSRNVAKAFHYIDPPYANADQGHYRGYTWEEYEKLLQQCEQLKGKFILSNYNSEMLTSYIEKNGWWKKEFVINNKGMRKNDRNKCEVLVANYRPVGTHELFN